MKSSLIYLKYNNILQDTIFKSIIESLTKDSKAGKERYYMKRFKKEKGFTLVEIIVVLVVIGILLAISIPSILGYVKKAQEVKYEAVARNANLNASEHINKALFFKTSSIEDLKNDLSLRILANGKFDNNIGTIIEAEPIEGYTICSVDVNFDNKTDIKGWDYDTKRENHTITKTSVRFCKPNADGKFTPSSIKDSKFVVTIHNDSMYYFDSLMDAYQAELENKPEAPLSTVY